MSRIFFAPRLVGASSFTIGLLVSASLIGCGGDETAAAAPSSTPTPALGEVEAFASLPASSEGLAFGPGPDGETNLYVGVRSHQLVRIAPDGTVTEHASIPEPVGVALGADGALVVCGTTSSTEPGAEAVLWRVTPDGAASILVEGGAEPFGLTNFVAVAPDGSLVFSDSGADRVYRADADGQNLALVTDAIAFPNGMTFSRDGKTLYVASWSTKVVWGLPWNGDGTYGAPEPFADDVENIDGLATFASGELLYVTSGDGVMRADADGAEEIAPMSAFGLPANGAFGAGEYGEGWVYVTTLLGTDLLRLWVGEGGAPLPPTAAAKLHP